MQERTLIDLIAKTKEAIKPFQHSPSTLWQYDYGWRGLCDYFAKHRTIHFSKELANQYVMKNRQQYERGAIAKWKFKLIRKTVDMLTQYNENGNVKWVKVPSWGQASLKTPLFICVLNDYVNELSSKGYGPGTIELRKSVAKKFLNYLEQEGLHALDKLKLETVSRFVPYASKDYQPTSMGTAFSALRSFLSFASAAQLTLTDLTRAIPSGFGKKTSIIPMISMQEEDQLIAAIDRNTAVGKRGYAMLLLALRLGLRSVDIINLKLEHIKWRKNTIEIIQQKTGRALTTPLLADVGNAIVDYLLHGRPASQEPYVFLRSQAPYKRMAGHASMYKIISNYMKKAGIRQADSERKGSHCCRHTVAARLLAAETPLPVISSILGQANKNSAMVYLSTDLEHLRACALDLAGIEVAKGELQC
ncbi:MAG: site-specific integrase [Syntrophales bacterium]|nr:site-specific integrase [Syntrophales bacterium]